MNISKKVIIEDFSIYKLGLLNFYLGIFFLSSALPISGIFLLIALLISIYINKNSYFKDKWNWPFIFTLILMFISCTEIIFSTNLKSNN